MRRIAANYIFPVSAEPVPDGVVTIDEDGLILDVAEKGAPFDQHLDGIICPGFINSHCHLELSHLRSQITEKKGMTGFIKELLSKRFHFPAEEIQKSIEQAEEAMIRNGIVGVGDISNNEIGRA